MEPLLKFYTQYDLTHLNTFGITVFAKLLCTIQSQEEAITLFNSPEFKENKKIFLGGGSNILFTENFDGIVIENKLKGIKILEENNETIVVRAMGGEIWHDLVQFAVAGEYWGIENLSLIPGTVGAAPMQNIGAYGADLKNVLMNVEALEIETGTKQIFTKEECELGYRDSIFKNRLKGKYFITAIHIQLSKKENKNIQYAVLAKYLEENNIEINTSKDISDAVSSIRRSKLPDPKVLGNAGSFFKNVFVKKAYLEKLAATFPDIPHFEEDAIIKIPAGWLIEKCGWKGKRIGSVGVHEKQALVLVNYGGATGADILHLAREVIASVKEKFGLELMPEVNIV